jgi:hypothetical protein
VLRRILGLKRDEIAGGWRKLHTEQLHNLYSSPNTIRMINEMSRVCGTHGGEEVLGGKPRKKETTRKTSTWTVVNIKTDLREIGRGGLD